VIGGKANSPAVKARFYSPKEFSEALKELGIRLCERAICRRARLPAGNPLRIERNQHFPGRILIPERELFRLAGISEALA
jgi:hypothetical protein